MNTLHIATRSRLQVIAASFFLLTASAFADSGTSTVSVTVAPEASITVGSSTSLTNTGTNFAADYTGSTTFSYKVRTMETGGSGTVTLRVTSDFAAGGPDGDTMTYTCTVVSPGTGCSSSVTASSSGETSVGTFGANAHSADAGNSGNSVAWTLLNKPTYQTGNYSATVTFTITAL